VAIIVNHTFHI